MRMHSIGSPIIALLVITGLSSALMIVGTRKMTRNPSHPLIWKGPLKDQSSNRAIATRSSVNDNIDNLNMNNNNEEHERWNKNPLKALTAAVKKALPSTSVLGALLNAALIGYLFGSLIEVLLKVYTKKIV